MGVNFSRLSNQERVAITEHVRAEYDRLVFQQPGTYISKHAEADPQGWQESMCELIATDPARVRAIVDKAKRGGDSAKGFTLIEMSVVLVIIGLIVGGILVGQTLIFQSQIRGTVTAMQKYQQAYNAFVNKYNCVPGDCVNASSYGLSGVWGYNLNGDGDGYIYSFSDSYTIDGGQMAGRVETWGALADLYQAKMIAESITTEIPTNNIPIPNGFMFFTSMRPHSPPAGYKMPPQSTNYLYLATYPGNGWDFYDTGGVLTAAQAQAIDQKIDDGLPMSGSVMAAFTSNNGCAGGYDGNVQVNGPCYNTPTLRTGFPFGSGCACVDNTTTPWSYYTAGGSNNSCAGQPVYQLCAIHLPVN